MLLMMIIFTVLYFITSMTMLRHWGRPPYDLRAEFLLSYTRFLDYVHGILTSWNWGVTGIYDESVWSFAWQRMWVTMRLNLLALAIYLPIGIILGIASALKKGSWFDRGVSTVTMVFGSIPHFILVLLLVVFFGIRYRIVPMQFPGFHIDDTVRLLKGLAIPMFALCMPPIFKFTRLVRAEFIDAQYDDYLLLCKTKGLTTSQTMRRHTFRNCMVPVLPELAPTFIFVLGGSFFVEMIYGIDGVARLIFDSLLVPFMDRTYMIIIDIPMTMVTTMFYAAFGLVFALLVDVAYPLVDPRIRIGAKPTDHQ